MIKEDVCEESSCLGEKNEEDKREAKKDGGLEMENIQIIILTS